MINATKTTDGSWPGEVHALVLSKMLKVRIVIVQNNYDGFARSFVIVIIVFLRALRAPQDFQKP